MEGLLIVAFLCAAALAAWGIARRWSKSRSLVHEWARREHLEILHMERGVFRRGPLFWFTSKGQEVFHVTLRERSGRVRAAWVRCGSWWWGLLSDKVEARWDTKHEGL